MSGYGFLYYSSLAACVQALRYKRSIDYHGVHYLLEPCQYLKQVLSEPTISSNVSNKASAALIDIDRLLWQQPSSPLPITIDDINMISLASNRCLAVPCPSIDASMASLLRSSYYFQPHRMKPRPGRTDRSMYPDCTSHLNMCVHPLPTTTTSYRRMRSTEALPP